MESVSAVQTLLRPTAAQTICAVIVTYHPDDLVSERIRRVVAQVPQTVIVDNGSPTSSVEQLKAIASSSAVHLIFNSQNEGLASALNAGVRWAASQGFDWVLTLDQDTLVAPDMVDTLFAVAGSYQPSQEVAVVGSNYRDKVNGSLFREPVVDKRGFSGRKIQSVVTSGSLISVSIFNRIGGFREQFFIDCIDHDYCLRARANGFQVILTSKVVMEHGIGHLTEHRLLGRTVHTSNHSAARRYFTFRNMMILTREYIGKEPGWITQSLLAMAKSVVLICLFEQNRIHKLHGIFSGCVDGVLMRTGSLRKWRIELQG
jgi:rhamnosyltransferase